MSTVVAKTSANAAGVRITAGNTYEVDDPRVGPVIKGHPDLFWTPEEAAKAQHRPQSTAELGELSMSARGQVEKATAEPGEVRDTGHPCEECGKVAKSAAGLAAHQRTHD